MLLRKYLPLIASILLVAISFSEVNSALFDCTEDSIERERSEKEIEEDIEGRKSDHEFDKNSSAILTGFFNFDTSRKFASNPFLRNLFIKAESVSLYILYCSLKVFFI